MALGNNLVKRLLGVKDAVVEYVSLKEEAASVDSEAFSIVIDVRPHKRDCMRCPKCGRKLHGCDRCRQPKLWRAPDFNGIKVFLRYRQWRVRCPEHGVCIEPVPWAMPATAFTKGFTCLAALLAMRLSRSAAAEMPRINWRTALWCITRTLKLLEPDPRVRCKGLVNQGIDETNCAKGRKHITTVVNHDSGVTVRAGEGHDKETLSRFFEGLTEEERAGIRTVSGDAAQWIKDCVAKHCPNARFCLDGFHAVQWAVDTVDEIRRGEWNAVRAGVRELQGRLKALPDDAPEDESKKLNEDIKIAKGAAREIKGTQSTLCKNPGNLTPGQRRKLEHVVENSPRLARAHRLKELVRPVFYAGTADEARAAFKEFFWKAAHSRLVPFKKLAWSYREHLESIANSVENGLPNALVESNNTKIKLMVRKAYGFKLIRNLLGVVMLVCSKLRIPLPNRNGYGMAPC